jgi:hypothetical protein
MILYKFMVLWCGHEVATFLRSRSKMGEFGELKNLNFINAGLICP